MVLPGVLDRLVESRRMALVERLDPDSLRPLGLGRLVSEVDRHAVEVAHGPVAARLEHLDGGLVGRDDRGLDRDGAALDRSLLGQVDQLAADPQASQLGMDVAVGQEALLAAVLQGRVARQAAVRGEDEPGIPLQVELTPFVGDFLGCEALASEKDALEGVAKIDNRIEVGQGRRADGERGHAGTSSSSTSGSGARSGISRVGAGSTPLSARRLTQTVVRPSAPAGTTSW